jgi:hypothetical protein
MLVSEITNKMTPDEYLTLAGKYCERMEWNHDAIPELAKCLELHDLDVVLKFARRTMDKQAELERELNEQVACNWKGAEREAGLLGKVDRLERENARLVNQIDNLRKCGTAVRNALSYSDRSWPNDQTKIREWDTLVGLRSDLPNV